MKVKICGITELDNALMVCEAGADMLGFNFYKPSPRYIDPEKATEICTALRNQLGDDCPVLVGVFANEAFGVISIITNKVGLDFAQLSGDETNNILVELRGMGYKAIRPMNKVIALDDVQYFSETMPQDERAPSLLIDAYHPKLYGGTGEQASTDVALAVKEAIPRLMLAGGLKPDNVGERVAAIKPWGVDVASGVEDGMAGIKDAAKIHEFIAAAKANA